MIYRFDMCTIKPYQMHNAVYCDRGSRSAVCQSLCLSDARLRSMRCAQTAHIVLDCGPDPPTAKGEGEVRRIAVKYRNIVGIRFDLYFGLLLCVKRCFYNSDIVHHCLPCPVPIVV